MSMAGKSKTDDGSKQTANNCIIIEDDDNGQAIDKFCIPKHHQPFLQSVLIPNGLIRDRIERLAQDICEDLDFQPVTVVCVLKGGFRFCADLSEQLQAIGRKSNRSIPIVFDYIRLKSYQNASSTGRIQVIGGDGLTNLKNKNVLIVEDIIDSGRTMTYLLELINKHEPKTLRVASLLVKRTPLSVGYVPDYCGFSVPDHFVVGYALDYNEQFRDLSHVCIINAQGKETYATPVTIIPD